MPVVPHIVPAALCGIQAPNQRSEFIKGRSWLISWESLPEFVGLKSVYLIGVDGRLAKTVVGRLSAIVQFPWQETAEVDVIQKPANFIDPAYSPAFEFAPAGKNNKGTLTWDPPTNTDIVEFYRIYWDKGTGVIDFNDDTFVYDEVPETGLGLYTFRTREHPKDTYKFAARAVTREGNEDTNVVEEIIVIDAYIAPVSGFSVSYNPVTFVATLTWSNPGGAVAVEIFYNGGVETQGYPDYSAAVATLGAVETWDSPALGEGLHVWGIRVSDGTYELNGHVHAKLRLDAVKAEITNPPGVPKLVAFESSGGTVTLGAYVRKVEGLTAPADVRFYTNDGAGGAVDYATPIATEAVVELQDQFVATFVTIAYGATTRLFGARARNAGGGESEKATEVSVLPNVTLPSAPLNFSGVADR